MGVAAVIGTSALPSLNEPDVVFEYTQLTTPGVLYGQYLKLAHLPVGAAAEADAAPPKPTPTTTLAATTDRKDFLITALLLRKTTDGT
jgi:hypothetical protein